MSYKLEQPYTDEKRTEFITEYGQDCWQRRGYIMRIEETDTALYALEPDEIMGTDETGEAVPVKNSNYKAEQTEKAKKLRIEEIKAKLEALDAETVRPLRAVTAGTATDEDIRKLKDIEAQVQALRTEYQALEV